MNDHDLQVLGLGAGLGAYLMLAVYLAFQVLDDRRDRKAARAAEAKLEAAQRLADGPDFVDTHTNAALIGKAGSP